VTRDEFATTDVRAALTQQVMTLAKALGQPVHWITAAQYANHLCDDASVEELQDVRDALARMFVETQ
jgi:hypothetical protein